MHSDLSGRCQPRSGTNLPPGTGGEVIIRDMGPRGNGFFLIKALPTFKALVLGPEAVRCPESKEKGLLQSWSGIMSPLIKRQPGKNRSGHQGHSSSSGWRRMVLWEAGSVGTFPGPTWLWNAHWQVSDRKLLPTAQEQLSPESPTFSHLHTRAACPHPSWALCSPVLATSASSWPPRLRWTSPCCCCCCCCWQSFLWSSSKEWVSPCGSWVGGEDVEAALGWWSDPLERGPSQGWGSGWSDQGGFEVCLCCPHTNCYQEKSSDSRFQNGLNHSWGQMGAGGASHLKAFWLAGMVLRGRANVAQDFL